jgi:hypothetical protein
MCGRAPRTPYVVTVDEYLDKFWKACCRSVDDCLRQLCEVILKLNSNCHSNFRGKGYMSNDVTDTGTDIEKHVGQRQWW